MKNCNEVVNDVFSKIDEYNTEKKQRRKAAKRIVAPAVCVCAAAAVVLGVNRSGKDAAVTNPSVSTSSAVTSVTGQVQENKIVINSELPENAYAFVGDFYLDINDYVPMSKDELRAFYGTEIFPRVPADMAEYLYNSDGGYGLFRADGGTGEITHDNILIMYTNRDAGRGLEIEVSKRFRYFSVNSCGGTPHIVLTGDAAASIINGTTVYISQNRFGRYSAGFIYNDTGFSLAADGFSEEELVAVIESLTECGDKYKGSEVKLEPVLLLIDSYDGPYLLINDEFDGEKLPEGTVPQNGEVILTPALLNAMNYYENTGRYNVIITVYENGKALDNSSAKVKGEIKRLADLGYTTVYEEHFNGRDSYKYVFACHADYEQLKSFKASDDYGYIISLYKE